MERVKTVFILGSGHCGATLLDLLLDSHSQMCGIGEFHAGRATSICTCGKPAPECEVWKAVMGPLGLSKISCWYFHRGIEKGSGEISVLSLTYCFL